LTKLEKVGEIVKNLLIELSIGAIFAAVQEILRGLLKKVMEELTNRQKDYLQGLNVETSSGAKQQTLFKSGNSSGFLDEDSFMSHYDSSRYR